MAVKHYNKLVRDRIPEIIEKDGKLCEYKTVDGLAYRKALDKKLKEECYEWLNTKSVDELCDIIEVCIALADEYHDMYESTLLYRMQEKRKNRGAFRNRIFLQSVRGGK